MNKSEHHDNFIKQASFYAKYRPSYPLAMYDCILEQVEQRGRAWDCATGSGQVAFQLSKYFDEVIGTDISQPQLDNAQLASNIQYMVSPAEQTPFEDHSFDLITVAQAIHWFDIAQFYEEVRRLASAKAMLAVIGYNRLLVNEQIDPIIHAYYEKMFTGVGFKGCRRLVESEYKTIPFPFEEIQTPNFSADYQWSIEDLNGFFYSWSSVQKYREQHNEDPTVSIIDELRGVWGEKRKVSFPVFMRLGKVDS
jgi:2-polyprenyl-3-methyl-5-hydroxy-6-metoxy-1,4-benzoquinol methylase